MITPSATSLATVKKVIDWFEFAHLWSDYIILQILNRSVLQDRFYFCNDSNRRDSQSLLFRYQPSEKDTEYATLADRILPITTIQPK